jgi:hypothetical protein
MSVDWGLRGAAYPMGAGHPVRDSKWMHYNLKIRWLTRGGRTALSQPFRANFHVGVTETPSG